MWFRRVRLRLLYRRVRCQQLFSQPLNRLQPFLLPQFLLRLNHRLRLRRLFLRLLNLLLPSLLLLNHQQLSLPLRNPLPQFLQPFLQLNPQPLCFLRLSLQQLKPRLLFSLPQFLQPFLQPLWHQQLSLLLPFHLLKPPLLFPLPLPTTSAGANDPCPTT